jgi:hypothetical protein
MSSMLAQEVSWELQVVTKRSTKSERISYDVPLLDLHTNYLEKSHFLLCAIQKVILQGPLVKVAPYKDKRAYSTTVARLAY